MAAQRHGLDDRLAAAVTAKHSDAVWACLGDGADPNTPGPDGLPLLCTAVAGFDHETAEALTEGGADSDRELPDGTTPLLRAVDLGSPALVGAVLGKDPRLRLAEAAQKRLLDLARHWHETGTAEELRRRTGTSVPATRRLTEDDKYTHVEEVSLGGLTVRAGHIAVLTSLEWAFGVLPPVAELMARAVPYPDRTHINGSTAGYILAHRGSPQDWSDLVSLRHHPDPVHRRFLADVLWHRELHIPSSTYYRWCRAERGPCERIRRDAELTEQIRRIHTDSGGSYGSPRVHAVLRREGAQVGRKRVERLMRAADLQGVSPRRSTSFTRRDPDATLADDLVQRDFTASAPNRAGPDAGRQGSRTYCAHARAELRALPVDVRRGPARRVSSVMCE
ncbi:hypothetical protein SRB5_11420 [Streptomyces sp. RB5]|uniref:HTH-like domain-containing protein n=1 Tax=Streptomyces smaragdinus TaxID=2585196 RepID=A0A7K0CC61_9ACTN|nr:IS3 family transposase [Streptomyces smaragdinus]MQY11028.1 hypothetical protein [Streptomyces smaragdinus]